MLRPMTTDALLAILLNVAIPSALALAGGILAAKALPDPKRTERALWASLFIGLALMAIVLAFIQQVRLTNQQQKADAVAAQRDGELRGENKYTQGQLDTLTKVLVSASSSFSSSSDYKATIGALLAATGRVSPSDGVEPPAIERMTNMQLKTRISAFTKDMRGFSAENEKREEAMVDQLMAAQRAVPASDTVKAAQLRQQMARSLDQFSVDTAAEVHQRYTVTAGIYKEELIRRLGPQPPTQENLFLWYGMGADTSPFALTATADYLDKLASQLP